MKGEDIFGFAVVVLLVSGLALVLSCFCTGEVSAHRMHVVHKISEIEVEAYFGGGTPVRDAEVRVYDEAGNLYFEGTTDKEGKFSFPPKIGVKEYRVVVDAVHMPGHRGETTINLSQTVAGAGAGGVGAGVEAEMPLYSRVVAGFGYLVGLAGAAAAYTGWKQKKKRHEKKEEEKK
ncbi:hypothetical protein B6V00_04535 [ANME-1 cluster archaeon ex4572_4]|nr:MAG: hypothetical protein B6V00_04535 [ANME-1 cluster archaeon ex4572_4]PXF51789.1 MAG: hypothetical protein C4B55_05410 [Methanophagales archaeon]